MPSSLVSSAYASRSPEKEHDAVERDGSSWSDTFTISWSLPLAAGNPYEGASVTAYYNGTPAPSPSPSPSPTGGVSAASTPSTGAGPIPTSSLVLIALGMVLLLAGAYGIGAATRSRRQTP